MADRVKTVSIICENCDSEYKLKFTKALVAGLPVHCAFCGEEIEDGRDDDSDDLDEEKSDDYE
jgi:hypothetical protein